MSYKNYDQNCNRDCLQKTEVEKFFMECGWNPQDAVFEIDDGGVENNQCFVLDCVLVDTSRLCKPQVKIDFSCLIKFEAESENGNEHEVDLLFKLERVCNGVAVCVRTWNYLKEFDVEGNGIDELEIEISEPFTVTFCDRACSGCYEYRMIVEGRDFEGEFDTLRVSQPSISAFVQGS